MATATTITQVGNREDLTEILERVAPEQTPFTSNIGGGKPAKMTYHEVQTETLAAANGDNARLEGAATTSYDENVTTKVGNHTQIFYKPFSVSRTQEKVDKAGRKSELARHRAVKSVELKRDIEVAMIRNGASRAQSGSDARLCGGAIAWLTTNVSRGAGGSNGGFSAGVVAAATNGTQRTMTEALWKTVMQSIFNASGSAKTRHAYMSAAHKQQFSAFTGISDIRAEVKGMEMGKIYGAADVYISDFGPIMTIPHPYALTRDVLIADHEYMGVSTLSPITEEKLAKVGDAENRHMIAEKTLEMRNERACGVVADLS